MIGVLQKISRQEIRKMKRVVSMLVCVMLCCFAFAGCNDAKAAKNTETNCVVSTYNGGYGMDAFKKVAAKFNEHYAEQGLTVTFDDGDPNLTNSSTVSQLQAGPKVTTTDLFLPGNVNFRYIVDQGSKFIAGYDCGLEDLTDILDMNVYGENVKYRDKVNPQFLDNCAIEKSDSIGYYTLPYMAGMSGFAYDAKLFEDNGWSVPKTTDELIALCDKMRNAKITPFVWASGAGYWDYPVYTWWRQMVTDEQYEDFWNGINSKGEQDISFINNAAQLRAFTIVEKLLGNTDNSHKYCMRYEHIEAQIALYTKSNKVAMMPTGDWLETEMKNVGMQSSDIGLFKYPMASDVRERKNLTTIENNAKLSDVISAIDENKNYTETKTATGIANLSESDYNEVKKMRSYMFSNGFMFTAMIPSYANAKDVAKKFILYMASDEAQQIFYNETHALLPYSATNLNTPSSPTRLQQYVIDNMNNATYISNQMPKNALFYRNGLTSWAENIEGHMGTTSSDKKNALAFQQYTYDYFAERLAGKI